MLIQKIKNFFNTILNQLRQNLKLISFQLSKGKNKMLNFLKSLYEGFIEGQRLRAEFRIESFKQGRGIHWE
jgi:ribosomal protein S8